MNIEYVLRFSNYELSLITLRHNAKIFNNFYTHSLYLLFNFKLKDSKG